jgi:hypothetical protein
LIDVSSGFALAKWMTDNRGTEVDSRLLPESKFNKSGNDNWGAKIAVDCHAIAMQWLAMTAPVRE